MKDAVEVPEVMPAGETDPARGRGRPRKVLSLVQNRTIAERAVVIAQHHEAARQAGAEAVFHAIMCGLELLAAHATMQHGEWEKWLAANCPFCAPTAWRYQKLAERKMEMLSNLAPVQDFKIGMSPLALPPAVRDQLIETMKDATDGESIKQLYLDFGIAKGKDELAIGGNAPLVAWLRREHPHCKARAFEDLPPALKEEFRKFLAEQTRLMGDAAAVKTRRKLHLMLEALRKMTAKDGPMHRLTKTELLHAAGMLGDFKAAILEAVKLVRE